MAEKYIKASDCEKYFYEHLDDVHIAGAMNAIDEMPAADVVPVKHGHWISLDDYFEDAQCSECGDALVIGDCSFNDFCECYKYCPNCGAKMDEKECENNA